MKMRILGRRHTDAVVGVDQAVMVDVMGLEPAFCRKYRHPRAEDTLCDAEIVKRSLNQEGCRWGTVDLHRRGGGSIALIVLYPVERDEGAEVRIVVDVVVRDEDVTHVGGLEASHDQLSCDAVSGVDEVGSSIDNQQIGRLGS